MSDTPTPEAAATPAPEPTPTPTPAPEPTPQSEPMAVDREDKVAETEPEKKEDKNEKEGSIQVAGRWFSSADKMMGAAYDCVDKLADTDQMLSGFESFLVFAVLERHPRFSQKMGSGVAGIGFGVNPEYPEVTRCFFVEHPDKSRSYFSLRKAADEIFTSQHELPALSRKRTATEMQSAKKKRYAYATPKEAGAKLPKALLSIKDELAKQGFAGTFLHADGESLRIEFATDEDAEKAIQEVKELKGVTVNMRALTAEEAEALLSRPQYGTKFPALGGGSRPGKKGGKKGGKGGKKGKKSGSSAQEVKPATEEKEAPAAAAPAEPAAAPTPSESTA